MTPPAGSPSAPQPAPTASDEPWVVTAEAPLVFEVDPSPGASIEAGQGEPAVGTQVATLRVIDDPQSPGLLESILGSVARAFGL